LDDFRPSQDPIDEIIYFNIFKKPPELEKKKNPLERRSTLSKAKGLLKPFLGTNQDTTNLNDSF